MEKIYLLLISFVFKVAVFGQTNIAVKAGVNVSKTKNLVSFPKNRAGWYSGLSVHIPVHNKIYFQPEIFYSSKGSGVNQTLDIGGYKSFRFDYLNMSLLLNYKFDKKTSIVIGPEFGYLLFVKGILVRGTDINLTKRYPSKFDAAVSVGLQYEVLKRICIEIRYNYGFNTLYYVDAAGVQQSETKGANRVFQTGVKYLFINKKHNQSKN